MKIRHDNRGAVTLLSTVVIFLVCLMLAEGIQFLGVGELQNGFTADLGAQAFALADGCADEGMERLALSASFTGETVANGNSSCTVSVTGSGGTRQIDASGSVNGTVVRKVRVNVTFTAGSPRNAVAVLAWQEVTT